MTCFSILDNKLTEKVKTPFHNEVSNIQRMLPLKMLVRLIKIRETKPMRPKRDIFDLVVYVSLLRVREISFAVIKVVLKTALYVGWYV